MLAIISLSCVAYKSDQHFIKIISAQNAEQTMNYKCYLKTEEQFFGGSEPEVTVDVCFVLTHFATILRSLTPAWAQISSGLSGPYTLVD
jgi:hypothetical protein